MTARHMTCCVCGAYAGHWKQHHNRDTGYGICQACVAEQAGIEAPKRMRQLYGEPGINHEKPTFLHMGRSFHVLATFRDTTRGARDANAFMARTPGASVLHITDDGRVIIAHEEDLGQQIGEPA